jgi:hypothetical protein
MESEMESSGSSARDAHQQSIPGMVNIGINRNKVDPEDDDEWEYEYSNTETEVSLYVIKMRAPAD